MKRDRFRCEKIMRECIGGFALDLSGFVVLTEAASGNFMVTALLSGLAGAREVIAVTRDSVYGSAADVIASTESWAKALGLKNILLTTEKSAELWQRADIVTNLGFVRPIDRDAVGSMKPTAVISLMWEPWEFRPEDIDLAACREKGILVMGTDEGHPSLDFRRYVGLLCLKLLLEVGVEVHRCRILVAGSGHFARAIMDTLVANGAETALVAPQAGVAGHVRTIASGLASEASVDWLASADALVVAEHLHKDSLLPEGASSWARRIARVNPSLKVVHLCGRLDRGALSEAGLEIVPDKEPQPGFMAVTTDYLGPRPVIELHTAGLKVGETMARARIGGLGLTEAAEAASRLSPAAPLECS